MSAIDSGRGEAKLVETVTGGRRIFLLMEIPNTMCQTEYISRNYEPAIDADRNAALEAEEEEEGCK